LSSKPGNRQKESFTNSALYITYGRRLRQADSRSFQEIGYRDLKKNAPFVSELFLFRQNVAHPRRTLRMNGEDYFMNTKPKLHRFTSEEYHGLVNAGIVLPRDRKSVV